MKPAEKFNQIFRVPRMTLTRIVFAVTIAMFADGLQLLSGFAGWLGWDQAIDVVAMVLVSRAIGFHWLLLPTFALELIPFADDLPTWTACAIAVIALRRREQRLATPPVPPDKPVVEI
jgi:hypothetical protein